MGHELPGAFLEGVRDNFVVPVLEGPCRDKAELGLLASSKEEPRERWESEAALAVVTMK